jgi:hypothetical protein
MAAIIVAVAGVMQIGASLVAVFYITKVPYTILVLYSHCTHTVLSLCSTLLRR